VDLVGQVLSEKYFVRGVSYEGADARDLTGFLLSLKGEKGFEDPGLLYMPRLLGKKYGLLGHYRVLDLRGQAAYARGHIPNAALWPDAEEAGGRSALPAKSVTEKLGLLGVRPEMAVVIYDDTLTPACAQVWWDLVRAGHIQVAILDGGFQRWVQEGGRVTTVVTPLEPTTYPSVETGEAARPQESREYPVLRLSAGLSQAAAGAFDWQSTVRDGQMRTASEIREYLAHQGLTFPGTYHLEGNDTEAAFLVYLLRLLGYSRAHYDPLAKLLTSEK
jgi:rhodanese-related sulfurtransferase